MQKIRVLDIFEWLIGCRGIKMNIGALFYIKQVDLM